MQPYRDDRSKPSSKLEIHAAARQWGRKVFGGPRRLDELVTSVTDNDEVFTRLATMVRRRVLGERRMPASARQARARRATQPDDVDPWAVTDAELRRATEQVEDCRGCAATGSVTCHSCSGHGRFSCPDCSGSGQVLKTTNRSSRYIQCKRCRASGSSTRERLKALRALEEELGDARVSDQDLTTGDKAVKDLNTEVENQHGEQKTIEDQVERMKKRLERSNKMRAELAADGKDLRTYNQLAGDLRSDKFQAYVLEEAFTELVPGASARLLSLIGERYSLLFQEGEILVVDNDNAGETRISDTNSGAETFLTSLSLALELSDQVHRAAGAVNLDSLFIDEGFGTLDSDTLALVSETIQNLRVRGRMVGIITHIPYSTVEVLGAVQEVAGA